MGSWEALLPKPGWHHACISMVVQVRDRRAAMLSGGLSPHSEMRWLFLVVGRMREMSVFCNSNCSRKLELEPNPFVRNLPLFLSWPLVERMRPSNRKATFTNMTPSPNLDPSTSILSQVSRNQVSLISAWQLQISPTMESERPNICWVQFKGYERILQIWALSIPLR